MRLHIKRYTILLLAFCLQISFGQENNSSGFQPAPITSGVLDNGMHYYIMHNEEPENRASFYFAQNVGSILEDDTQQGLAHFLEHMAFNGTRHFKDKEMLEYLEKNGIKFGAEINAFTSFDETVYNINRVPVQNQQLLDSVLLAIHDWSGYLLLTDEEIDNERGVIKEEWRSRNTPRSRASDKIFKEGVLKGSKYANRMSIGKMEVVDNFHYDALRNYYSQWYRPDQQALIVVGDVDVQKMEEKIKNTFKNIPLRKNLPARGTFEVPLGNGFTYITATDKELGDPVIQYYIKHKADNSLSEVEEVQQSLQYQLVRYIFNNRLSEVSRAETSPVLSANFSVSNFVRPLDILAMGVQPKKDSLLPALEFTLAELKRFVLHGATTAELERAKAAFRTNLEAALKNIDKRNNDAYATAIYSAYFKQKEVPDYRWNLNYRLAYLDTINNENLLEYLQKYYSTGGNIVAFTGSDTVKYPAEEEVVNIVNGIKDLNPEPFKEELSDKKLINTKLAGATIINKEKVKGIKASTYTLSNGARVTLYPTDYDKEQVYFHAFSPGGKSLLPVQLLPNALITTFLASESGLGSMDKIELRKYLQGTQTSLSVELNDYEEQMGGKSTWNDVETLMKRIYLSFTGPRFDDRAMEIIKQNLETSLISKKKNVQSDFKDSLQLAQSNYSNREVLFNQQLIDNLSLETAETVYRNRITNAADFNFIFVGDFQTGKLLELVKTYIGSIPGTSLEEKALNHGMKPEKGITKVHMKRTMETPQTTVNIYFTGVMKYTAKNRLIMNIIGQLLSKRYLERIREEEGGSYGVQALGYMQHIPEDSFILNIGFSCNPEKTNQLVKIVYEDVEKLSREVDSDEFIEIKNNLKKSVAENKENNSYWMNKIVRSLKNKMPVLSEKEVLQMIDSVKEKDIKEIVQKIKEQPRVVEGILTPLIQ
ncbi:M16 family metallopeptidase [Abyssalbus ytuae]|uniref:Insulinase family protein n=1 Tax=Abyssalbus ytuae TaxID=2926907 RepID=A0A9E6ZM10_9FLAO|nr:insulinase family protein [Abyssalbus ytuae]UOB16680.1 insulinase family protein [Abyssalbus ytuae]